MSQTRVPRQEQNQRAASRGSVGAGHVGDTASAASWTPLKITCLRRGAYPTNTSRQLHRRHPKAGLQITKASRRAVIQSPPGDDPGHGQGGREAVCSSPKPGVIACICRWWCGFHHAACAQIDSVRCLRPGTGWPRPRANRRIGRRNDPTDEISSSGDGSLTDMAEAYERSGCRLSKNGVRQWMTKQPAARAVPNHRRNRRVPTR